MADPAQLLSVGHVAPDPAWRVSTPGHDVHELIVVLRGTLHLECPEGRFRLEAGDVVLYPARMPHVEWTDPNDPLESYFCQLTTPQVSGTRLLRRHDHSGRLRQIIHWLHADQGERSPPSLAERRALFQALMARFLSDGEASEGERVRRVRDYVKKHGGEPLDLARLARVAGLSPFHFARTYRRLAGVSPMADVRRMRLNRARDLVMTSGLSLKEIALKTGFGNPYAFSRLFRRQFGMPPGEFRRRLGHEEARRG